MPALARKGLRVATARDRSVLLVDDEPDILLVAQMSLELVGGLKVLAAGTASEGLSLAARERPDAILLDVTMPGMDGPQALARLKADAATADIPVIFMTARVQGREVSRHLERGAAGVIYKPFDPMTLAQEIARIAWVEPEPGAAKGG